MLMLSLRQSLSEIECIKLFTIRINTHRHAQIMATVSPLNMIMLMFRDNNSRQFVVLSRDTVVRIALGIRDVFRRDTFERLYTARSVVLGIIDFPGIDPTSRIVVECAELVPDKPCVRRLDYSGMSPRQQKPQKPHSHNRAISGQDVFHSQRIVSLIQYKALIMALATPKSYSGKVHPRYTKCLQEARP